MDNAEPRGKIGLIVNIDLINAELIGHFFADLLYNGAECSAGPPRSPEV